MNPYKWLILDADGTLFDFHRAEAAALELTPQQLSILVPNNFSAAYHAVNAALWKEFEAGTLAAHDVRRLRFRQVFEQLQIEADADEFSETFLTNLVAETTFLEGAERLLTKAKDHFGLVLLTNGFADVQHARIARLKIGTAFDHIVISEEVGVAKPDPAIFDFVFDLMGSPDKAQVLMVGDSLSSDIQGGVRFGVDTCWFNPDELANTSNLKPTYEVSRLDEVESLLGLEEILDTSS